MFKKSSQFIEEHIEKIVLGVVGLVCIWLLITRVLISPNAVSYDNQKFSPGGIDPYVRKLAEQLQHKLNEPPEPKPPYPPRLDGPLDPNDPVRDGIPGDLQHGFAGLVDLAIPGIDTRWSVLLPPNISPEVAEGRQYPAPLVAGVIGEVKDVAAGHLRAAAYMPTLPVTPDLPYENAAPEPNDIDLVTVEGKFDVAQLYKRFQQSFAGVDIPVEWRDPCLAVPVFAAVQLQRQELLDDGSWGEWHDVRRTKIDYRRRMFEIIEDVGNLPPGGVKVRLLQFNDAEVRMDLLQPQAYQIASANREWFPPSLHAKFVELQSKEKLEARREEIEAAKQEKEREREQRLEERRGGTLGTRSGPGGVGGGSPYYEGLGSTGGLYGERGTRPRRGRYDLRTGRGDSGDMGLYDDTGLYGDRRRPPTRGRGRDERDIETEYMMGPDGRQVSQKPSINDVYYEFEGILLTPRTELAKMREPLLFWAHDDTVEPGESYRYRIRLGVFNPIGGTNQFSKQDASLRNAAILWSNFSEVTQPVTIPKMLYFFAKEIQEAAKKVTVQVSKYVLGYWYSKDFPVNRGEAIGNVVESEPEEPKDPRTGRFSFVQPEEKVAEPEAIDYSTGAVLVDAVAVNDWSGAGRLLPRHYFDMLYTFDGAYIEHMPIKLSYWSEQLLAMYNEIRKSEREPKEPLRGWDSRIGGRRRGVAPGLEEFEEEYYDEEYQMMMEEMMGGMRRY